MKLRADRWTTGAARGGWPLAVFLSAFLFRPGVPLAQPDAAPPGPGFLAAPLAVDSLSATPDSLTLGSAPPTAADSADVLNPATFVGPPEDTLSAWRRLLRRPSTWPNPALLHSPDRRPLPTLTAQADRPAEDLADELQPLVAGSLFDQAQLGHRQLLALDGLRPGASSIHLDGLDLSSRISGLSDLNLVVPGLTRARQTDPWERLGSRPGGSLVMHTLRATDDSVLTRVRWADGFLGLITAEGDFQRPILGGRAFFASRQTYTHERIPGAHYRGNLFLWNWDRPLGAHWLLQVDQRLLRDRSEVLDVDGSQRRLRQNLLRGRLSRMLSDRASLGLDLWQRQDLLSFSRSGLLDDRERLAGATLRLDRTWAGGGWHVDGGLERQRLSSDGWVQRRVEASVNASAAWTRPMPWGRLALEPALDLRHLTDDDLWGWSAGTRVGLTRMDGWGDLLLQAGQLPPTPEQLHLTRDPGRTDAVVDPWRRAAGLPLLPDSLLAASRWRRQELRLGTDLWDGRLPIGLRLWRVDLLEDPHEAPASDSTWSWRGFDHVNWGAQVFARFKLAPSWQVRLAQGWFVDSRDLLSREAATYLVDGSLTHERLLYGGELRVLVTAGLHHEYGGVDSAGDALWGLPELWLQGEATRKRFTFWWALRNPFNLAENSRVEGRTLHGHEEWLGIRWGFVD